LFYEFKKQPAIDYATGGEIRRVPASIGNPANVYSLENECPRAQMQHLANSLVLR
jgi:hypothetical protein